ncbi:hypothetical protein THOM_0427 [Trachipleistophora hominis]|uniref:Uncharacterized protein n=1 Tax=Trachipleistophora hominis TaxID=72359 RepID=L7K058_TRAHO|nr:hypothetical protein THOM_0427 [Trachipleistophora hominis]
MRFNPQVSIMLGAFVIMQVFSNNVMARGSRSRHRGSLFGLGRIFGRRRHGGNTFFQSIVNTIESIWGRNSATTKQEDQGTKEVAEQTAMKHIIMPASNPATDIMDEKTLTLPNSRKGVKRIYSVEKKGTDSSSTKLEFATPTVENALNNLMLFLGDGLKLLSEMVNEKFDALDFIRGGDFNDTMIDEEQDSIRKQLRVQLDRTNRIFNDKEHGILTCVDETNNTFDLNLIAAERFAAIVENIEVLLADVSLTNTNST